ncbi:MAG TPA: cytochrome d ubiquinol oxidase subunit II [Candidatus Sumerlaeota bacterium]|nr:MAG: Cytochrome bd-I ubiquinol oxidase subunit 2 [candidate division BRC1 bacterium ADurb.BinA292]HOE95898.1 cytochrome d ubiquinol oxidase subunit II [Candidatus Sumerlaeota bacterium]HPK02200.1 cytochrome d ubiquinol oxidase subunit II [Candidatus Sumerlaeota bacterium]
MILNEIWFLLVGVLLIGYAILDGFDLGVGALHLFSRGDTERRLLINAIGPVWDGNEVWLVTAGGALFAAFPHAYATAFSAFYLPFILLLFMLIFRALAIEFRGKEPMGWWRRMWDVSFCVASIVASVLFGVAIGNMALGIPVGPDMEYQGNLLTLLGPYPLLVGVFNLSIFTMHGAIYLYMKTEGDLQRKVKGWIVRATAFFIILYVLTTVYTLAAVPSMIANFRDYPWIWGLVVLNVLAIANIPRAIYHEWPFRAFLSSCAAIAALISLFGMGVYPNLIRSTLGDAFNLTIVNAASSQKTLGIMLLIAVIGIPFVLAYTAAIYWIFRGKVRLGEHSY